MLPDKPAGAGSHTAQPVHMLGTLVDVLLASAALIVFNLFPDWIGFSWRNGELLKPDSILAPAFWAFLPWLNAVWIMGLVIGLVNLFLRHWTVPLRALDMTRDLLTILVLALMIAGAPLVLNDGLAVVLRLVLAIALFAVVADLVGKTGHLMGGTHIAPPRPA